MRRIVIFLAVTLLASCSDAGSEGENRAKPARAPTLPDRSDSAAGRAAEAPQPEPREVPATAGTTANEIPAAFAGIYDETIEACTRPSQYRLQLARNRLRFHESIGTVAHVRIDSPTSISVTADYEGEGEKWRSVRQLDMTDDGRHLVVSGDGTSFTRIRCP